MTEIPKATVVRIAKQEGVERVSEDAATALTEAVEKYARNLSITVNDLADHADRKTIKDIDVELALKHF